MSNARDTPVDASEIRSRVEDMFAGKVAQLPDQEMDDLLGICAEETESELYESGLSSDYLQERFLYEGTPYILLRSLFHELSLSADDILFDLGSGYGRVVFYAGIVTRAQIIGVEIVPERIASSLSLRNTLRLERVDFIRANVLEYEYSRGTVFFLFNPFTKDTLHKVAQTLEHIANQKHIRIVSVAECAHFFDTLPWLHTTYTDGQRPFDIRIYRSHLQTETDAKKHFPFKN